LGLIEIYFLLSHSTHAAQEDGQDEETPEREIAYKHSSYMLVKLKLGKLS
jgi:hypothetical protein